MEVSADSVTVLGPSTTVSLLVASVAIVRGALPMLSPMAVGLDVGVSVIVPPAAVTSKPKVTLPL